MKTSVNIITILWGQKYSEADVNRLLGMIQKNSSHPLAFHLFSDEPLPGLDPSIKKHPEPGRNRDCYHEKYNYRKEAALCDDALGELTGQRVFFFDLDVLITGNLDELFDYPEGDNFYIINDWNTRGNHVGQASCYSFVVGKLGQIKDYFEANSENVINNFGTASQEYLSDQVQKLFGSLNFWPDQWFKSFKFHCLPVWFLRRFIVPAKPPAGTKVLAFHGHPDLQDALNGTWREKKKHRWKIWKKLYKCCKPTLWIADYYNHMNNSSPELLAWGHYSPSSLCKFLKLLTSVGLARGKSTHSMYQLWLKFHGTTVDTSVRGIRYRLNITDNITDKKILCSSRMYDQAELHFLKEACHKGAFVDAGANIGYYSLFLAKNGAKTVLSIEPNPRTIERLRFNIATNDLGNKIQIESSGIGELGESSFNSNIDLGCASIVDDQETGDFIKIKTKPLLQIVQEHGLQEISGMKIDIEGHEDRALIPFLQNAPKELWPKRIVLEHAHEKQWQLDLNKVTAESGYTLLRKTRANSLLQLRSSQ